MCVCVCVCVCVCGVSVCVSVQFNNKLLTCPYIPAYHTNIHNSTEREGT